jgi:acyl-CoA hydrolase
MKLLDASRLELANYIRPGDGVLWGQIAAEPQTLTEALVAQRAAIGPLEIFLGGGFSKTLLPEHGDYLKFVGMGPAGTHRRLAAAGLFDVKPFHISQIEGFIQSGAIRCDVVLLQVSPPNERGEYSYGITGDYLPVAVKKARVVIAEINQQIPWTYCTTPLVADDIDFAIETDRPPVQVPSSPPSDLDRSIAAFASKFIPDRATLQVGIGGVPDVLLSLLRDRRGLGVHSGIIGESVAELMRDGVVTNEHKGIDSGKTVTGTILGTSDLYRFFHKNPALLLAPISHTHSARTLLQLANFVSVNSALEVDLTGQVNSEALGDAYIGAVGGQVDFVRAAALNGGRSLFVLPSTAQGGASTRIVPRLSGPVTTARSDVDVIITEHGAAELRGRSISERARAMIAIADPAHREALEREARELFRKIPTWH